MIPIGLPSLQFVLVLLGFLAATLVWIIWLIRLGCSQRARQHLRSWHGLTFALLTCVGCYTLWSAYAFQRDLAAYRAEEQANYHPVLAKNQRLGNIDMPSGTELKLGIARQLEAFNQADFPHPVSIAGVQTLRAERYLSIHTDEHYRTTGFTPKNLRLTGQGESRQQGWTCDATAPIEFTTHTDGSIRAFYRCTAGRANRVEGEPLPEGAEIIATEGTLYLDGRRDEDRWLIHLPQDAGLQINSVMQQGGAILLDAERKVVRQVPR